MSERILKIGRREIKVLHEDKVLFPDDDITKGDILDYYQRIGESMLPYMEDRPISMQRFPNGIDGEGFYQKEIPDYFPDWIDRETIPVQETGEEQEQVVCNQVATLVYIANQGTITPHIWLSRTDDLYHPDRMIFDFDPATDDFEPVRQVAQTVRRVLEEIGLTSFAMTTGSRGAHVVIPLDRSAGFDTVREFAKNVADVVAHWEPDRYTTEVHKDQRRGRVFVDYLRNSYGQTSVTPYAVRPRRGAPVATPLDWDELSDTSLNSQTYTITNIFQRLGHKEDPWKGMMRHARSLSEARDKLDQLLANG
jgi:bifunctional non-homologous end joining protein LigD